MNNSLNHIYRVVWNATLGLWQVASEVARNGGKTQSEQRKTRRLKVGAAAVAGAFAGLAGLATPSVAFAQLPTGGQVVGGQASISQVNSQSGNTLNINQTTDRAAIDWQSFNVGQGNTVNFNQPSASSIALNRVLGSDVSVIQGAINANGQVFLVNQNGVLFTPTAQVNVGGIVASTQNISTADFMAGKHTFSGNSTGTVENQGSITAATGGTVALIAAKIVNTGTITAPQGTVGLAAGNTVTLDLGGPVKIQVTQGALSAAVQQGGGIVADGGQIYLTAKAAGNLAASVINHTGISRARSLALNALGQITLNADLLNQAGVLDAQGVNAGTQGGLIELNAGLLIDGGETNASGHSAGGRITQRATEIMQSQSARLSAKGTDANSGQGGRIEILAANSNAGNVYLSGQMDASAVTQGGQVDVSGNRVTLSGASLNTSGSLAGKQRIGGGWQGRDEDINNAVNTRVLNSTLNNQGQGGTVVVWSDEQTTFASQLNAGSSAVEISGKENLAISLEEVVAKSLLLDPKNIEIKTPAGLLNVTSIVNPNNNAGDAFGQDMLELSNGNLVISAFTSDLVGESKLADVGRVYLYSSTGQLISTLSGSSAGNFVGTRLLNLGNGNFVVSSTNWDAPTQTGVVLNVGAVTWVNGTTGLNGVVSSDNSLVGNKAGDGVGGSGVLKLNGSSNYVVSSIDWDNGAATEAGAVTWGSGTSGVSGVVSSDNSLVGVKRNDRVGAVPGGNSPIAGILLLSNGNYVVRSAYWDSNANGFSASGAVTFGSGATGVKGAVSSINSLVGSVSTDDVGRQGVVELSNGNYVVQSQNWNGGRGAVTWGSGKDGVSGTINAENSLVGVKGGSTQDLVGERVIALAENGNYVVVSSFWDNGGTQNVGAVTWGNGSTGTVGEVSTANSLIGSTTNDRVGSTGVTALTNGNYVVVSGAWDNGAATDAGAVTFGNGATGTTGAVGSSNSLVGTKSSDAVGTVASAANGVVALSNGNYVVRSSNWDNGSIVDAGAVTWGNGTTGATGLVSIDNSLVGSTNEDRVGGTGLVTLDNGNYLVLSSTWNNGAAVDAGAVTWGDGTTGMKGAVDDKNSLVGSTSSDGIGAIGTILKLTNNNYVVLSGNWDNGSVANVGAATWGSGATGVSGVISSTNSLIGSTANDRIGTSGVALKNGNYVVTSGTWDNNGIMDAGAATWGDGSKGRIGVVGIENSLVGGSASDQVGGGGVFALANGNYLVGSIVWDRGSIQNAGALTWGNGSTGITGLVSEANSLVGNSNNDFVGFSNGVREFGKNQYALFTSTWDRGSLSDAGALVFANSDNGFLAGSSSAGGTISEQNAIVGDRASAAGSFRLLALSDGRYVVRDTGNPAGGTVYFSNGSASSSTADPVSGATFSNNPGANSVISPTSILALLNAGTAVSLQANNDITLREALIANADSTGALQLEAGRNINFNANLNTGNGNITATAGAAGHDPANRDAGDSTITIASGVTIAAGTGTINLIANNVGNNIGKFVNNAGATPFTAAKTFIYLPSFNTLGDNSVTHAALNGLTVSGKRYNTTFNATTGAPTSSTAKLDNLTGVNLLYAAAPVITVTPSNQSVQYGDKVFFENSPLSGFVDGDSGSTSGAVLGTEVIDIVGAEPVNGLRNVGKYSLVYKSGYTSDLGYTFTDAAQVDELTITPRNLTVTTNNFLASTTDAVTVAGTEGLVNGQTFTGFTLTDNLLTANFGQNTLGSNYNTTVLVPGAAASDLTVKRSLTFNGLNLTLKSDKNINIRNTITAQGANDKVQLRFGQGAVAVNNAADFNLALSPKGFDGKLNIREGNNFSTVLGSDGSVINYTVITSLGAQGSTTGTDLQGMNGMLSGNFALGTDIDAAATSEWDKGTGFDGIGSGSTPFAGRFTGLGHQITALTINRPDQSAVGLFDRVGDAATLRDIQLMNAKVTGNFNVGALAGSSNSGSRFYQVVSSGDIQGNASVGGLIGFANGSSIAQSFSAATVSSLSTNAGGLVGESRDLTLKEVFATGVVSGAEGVGGLVGRFATSGAASITDAYATGAVTAKDAQGSAGGLLGVVSTDVINASYDVSFDRVYATGKVTGEDVSSGGLIGIVRATNNSSGALATVALTNSFWDTDATEQMTAIGAKQAIGGTITDTTALGKTTAELQQRATFTAAGWNIAGSGGMYPVLSFGRSATVWTIGALQIPVAVTFNALTGTYTYKASEYALTDLFSTASLFGQSCEVCSTTWKLGTDYTFSFNNTTVTGFTDAGTYNNIGIKVLNQDYALAETGNTLGMLMIDRVRITAVTGINANSKTYDGKTVAELNTAGAKFTGVLQNETGTLTVASAIGNFADKNVANNKTVNITNIKLGGTAAKNYELSNASAAGVMPPVLNTANTATAQADIKRLASVTWVGGATGNWFDAANWAGGAVPDLANVASVVLPANVKVNFNGAMDAVMIDSLGSLGAMDMASGTLNVGTGGITLAGFNQTGGTLSTTGNFNVSQATGAVQLGNLAVEGTMTVKTNGAVSQLPDSVLTVKGATSVDAGANDVTLANAGNDFGSIGVTAKAASIADKNAVALDTIKAASLAVKAGGAVTQVVDKALEVTGATSVDAGANDVTLANAGNDFGSIGVTAKAASIADKNAVALDTIKAASLDVKAGGAVTQVADKALEVTGATSVDAGANDVTLANAGNDFGSIGVTAGAASIADKNAVALDNIKAASLSVKAGGAVTQVVDKALEVTGATSVDAGANAVTLANAGNDFNSVAITAGAASVTDKNAVSMDNIKAASLAVKAGGAVTQVADKALEVTGATSVDAGANDVTLANAGNDFGSIGVTAKAASIADKNAVVLDTIKAASLALKAGGAVTQVLDKALEVTGATSVDAGANAVTLANAGNDFGSIGVTAKAASIADKNAVALDNIKAASLAVKAGGAVIQVVDKALEVTGATSVDAGANDVTLANAGNDFGSIGVTAKAASIADKNAVALDTIKAASLALKAGGAVTQVVDKALEVTGATSVDAGANAVTLANAGNDFGSIGVTAGAASIADKNSVALDNIKAASLAVKAGGAVTQVADKALEVKGATSVDAGTNNVTVANAGNDFDSIGVTAGAVSIADKNAVALDNIKAASLSLKAGGEVTQVLDKALEVTGATSVDAGANDVTLANAGNDFGSIGVTAKAASITDKNAVAMDTIKAASLDVKAGGAVTQLAEKALEVTGATSVDAGANDVTLANAGNDFNSVAITAGAASVTDKNAVSMDNIKAASLAVKAGGAVTQVADKALEVTGATSVDAGANDVTLANAGNDFGSIGVTAKAASIIDKNAVTLGNMQVDTLEVKAGGAIEQNSDSALRIAGRSSFDTPEAIRLPNLNNRFGGPVSLRGTDASLGSDAQINVGERNIRSLELSGAANRVALTDSLVRVSGITQFVSSNQTVSAPATAGPDSLASQSDASESSGSNEQLFGIVGVARTVPSGQVLVIDGGINLDFADRSANNSSNTSEKQ